MARAPVQRRELTLGVRAGVVGHGMVGRRAVRQLGATGGVEVLVAGRNPPFLSGVAHARPAERLEVLTRTDVVILATPPAQRDLAALALQSGVHVISTSDRRPDVAALLGLADLARRRGVTLVIGATAAPGLSGLLARYGAAGLSQVDEIHVQAHGTGGPACALQHHVALAGRSLAWHDGAWDERPSGTGRELLWFPDPVGAHDCYRADLVDPLLLHDAFPEAQRITARLTATRRDRLTARLPMLRPPHPEGLVGGVRVEVRGSRGGRRSVVVMGNAQPLGVVAGAVTATLAVAAAKGALPPGAVSVASAELPTTTLLRELATRGVHLERFDGATASTVNL